MCKINVVLSVALDFPVIFLLLVNHCEVNDTITMLCL